MIIIITTSLVIKKCTKKSLNISSVHNESNKEKKTHFPLRIKCCSAIHSVSLCVCGVHNSRPTSQSLIYKNRWQADFDLDTDEG